MKYIAIIILSLSLIGCSTTSTQDSLDFQNNLKRFSTANVSRAKNTIFIGKKFPSGRVIRINYSKAKQLQKILSHSQYANSGNSANYAADLCYMVIAGRTWYFRPSFKPYGFKLPYEQQKQMENILRKEFGVR